MWIDAVDDRPVRAPIVALHTVAALEPSTSPRRPTLTSMEPRGGVRRSLVPTTCRRSCSWRASAVEAWTVGRGLSSGITCVMRRQSIVDAKLQQRLACLQIARHGK